MGWMQEVDIIVNPFIHCVVLVLWVTGINLFYYIGIRIMWWFNFGRFGISMRDFQ